MAATQVSYNKIFKKIHSALPKYLTENNDSMLLDTFEGKVSDSVKCLVEAAIRHYVIGIFNSKQSIDLNHIKIIVKICIEGARQETCLPTLPILVLSDAFDCITIDQCEELFKFVENIVSDLKDPIFFATCKNQVLRMCNDVLRRLSRTQNTIFCGRILLFLARFFPFSERSGLNLTSEFNLENLTSYASTETEAEAAPETTNKEQNSPDFTLYTKFWALQDYFRNPAQCFQPGSWELYTKYVDDVLEAFSSFKLDPVQTSKCADEAQPEDSVDTEDQVYEYFPKYLTSQKLLDLQFSDSNFRRFTLVQMLILAHYLTSQTRFKEEKLNVAQFKWVRGMKEKAYCLMAETPPNGKEFADIVRSILKKENEWSTWKNKGCPEIKKPLQSDKIGKDAQTNGKPEEAPVKNAKPRDKRKLGEIVREAESRKKFVMGNDEMTRLWNICPDSLESCRKECRNFVPSLEAYFKGAVEQVLGKANVKSTDKLVNDSNFGWRALRLLASKSPHFFTNSGNAAIAALPDYLTTMIEKVAKVIPQAVTEEAKEEDEIEVLEENVDEADEAEDESQREDLKPEDLERLAKALTAEKDAYKKLAKKLAFSEDEVQWMMRDKPLEKGIEMILQRWVEDDADANKADLIYMLEGLKLHSVVKAMHAA